jgi:hypothetical protein
MNARYVVKQQIRNVLICGICEKGQPSSKGEVVGQRRKLKVI